MRSFSIYICIATCFFILGCSEPEIVIPPLEVPISGKKVLVEELTGVRCPNCPSATARLESIKLIYGENIIQVNIHGNLLTRPLPESQYDFRNNFAIALEEFHQPFIGKPSVIINRKLHPSFDLKANPLQDQWQPIIEEELQLEQEISIVIDPLRTADRWEINIGVVPLKTISGEFTYHAYLTENNIVDAQEDVDRIISDYTHDHVLRMSLTPILGVPFGNILSENEVINLELNLLISDLNPEWNLNNLEIIFFITNENGEVLQVEKSLLRD